jgi:trigger factor
MAEDETKPRPDKAPDDEQVDVEALADLEGVDEAEEDDGLPPVEVDIEDLGALRRKLKISVPGERIDAKRDESIRQLAETQQVPGFRIGRAPRRLIEKRFGTELTQDLKTQMVAWGYTQAIEKEEIKVLGEPDMNEEDLDAIEVPEDGPLTFEVTVEVQPEFELPELEGIKVTRPIIEITDESVDGAIERWQSNFATQQPVEGAAEPDDILIGTLTFEPEGGEKHEHPDARIAVRPQAIEGVPIEDLGDRLAGTEAGQTVTIETTVPEGHPNEDIRGKAAVITLAVREVRRTHMPELDEEFIGRFGFDQIDEFRDWVRGQLEQEAGQQQRRQMHEQVHEHLRDSVDFEMPEGALERMKSRAVQRRANELMMRGVPRTEIEKHIDELEVTAGEEAERELKSYFIMQKVSEQLGIEVADEEVNAAISSMAAQYGQRPDALRDDMERRGSLDQLVNQIREQKAVDQILEKAEITDAPPEEDKSESKPKTKKKTKKKSTKKKTAKKKATKSDDEDDADAT